jgi:hypothetical protein
MQLSGTLQIMGRAYDFSLFNPPPVFQPLERALFVQPSALALGIGGGIQTSKSISPVQYYFAGINN